MKKVLKKIRNSICIISVIILNTCVFAAIVSDNDGSAFVTKAEFEALKSSFNAQIDSYNTSIDNKIDGAIASYLAGIKLAEFETRSIIFSKWEDITCMNGSIDPTFNYPEINIEFDINALTYTSPADPASGYQKIFYEQFVGNTYFPTAANWEAIKPLCTNINEAIIGGSDATAKANELKKLTWNGVAKQYKEKHVITRLTGENGDPSWMGYSDRNNGLVLNNLTTLLMNGYYSNYNNQTTNVINPTGTWRYTDNTTKTTWYDVAWTFAGLEISKTNSASVELGYIGGKQKEYEHILNWKKDTEWYLFNETFVNTFHTCPLQTYTSKTIMNRINLKSAGVGTYTYDFGGMEAYPPYDGGTTGDVLRGWLAAGSNKVPVSLSDSNDRKLPSIGMLEGTYRADKIAQHVETVSSEYIKYNTYYATPSNLAAGFQVLFAEQDSVIEWDLDFSNVVTYDSSDAKRTNVDEVNVMLSMTPFGDENSTAEVISLKNTGTSAEGDYVTTSNRQVGIKWTMPKSGLVWLKFWPAISGTLVDSKPWEVTLNLDTSKTYRYRKPE